MKKITVVLILISLALSGCSVYTFNPKGKSSISSIDIERFTNKTPEYGLEDKMTDQITDAFINDGTLKVVPAGASEATLSGALVSYSRKAYNPDESDRVSEYAVYMTFEIKLTNPEDGSEIWNERVSQTGVYNLETETELDGQQRAIELLIESIINKTTKSW